MRQDLSLHSSPFAPFHLILAHPRDLLHRRIPRPSFDTLQPAISTFHPLPVVPSTSVRRSAAAVARTRRSRAVVEGGVDLEEEAYYGRYHQDNEKVTLRWMEWGHGGCAGGRGMTHVLEQESSKRHDFPVRTEAFRVYVRVYSEG